MVVFFAGAFLTGASTGAHTHLELRPKGTTSDSLDIIEFTGLTNKVGVYEYVPEYTLDEDLAALEKAGIMNTPSYWKQNVSKVKYLDELFRNMAKFVRK